MNILGGLFGGGGGGGRDHHHDFQLPSFFFQPPDRQQPVPSSYSCELEITGGTSWKEYMKNVNNPHYGLRCTEERINNSCKCQNPLIPYRPDSDQWTHAFNTNLHRITQWDQAYATATIQLLQDSSNSSDNDMVNNVDVVFLGDSITEHWAGESFGKSNDRWIGNAKVFQQLFGDSTTLTPGPETELLGMPLGISADRCPNLLYRLQNGLIQVSNQLLDPALWWILIGTNDRGGDSCLEDHVVAGIIAIVEYILQERPNAKIVINSILPRGPDTANGLKYWKDYYQPINQALECYTQGHQGNDHDDDNGNNNNKPAVFFFNATDLFLTSDGQQRINLTLLPDELHPEEAGSWVWGRAMAKKIHEILALE